MTGTTRVTERNEKGTHFSVAIDGTQYPDGRAIRFIRVVDEDGTEALIELKAEVARQLGSALVAAADEVERSVLAQSDPS